MQNINKMQSWWTKSWSYKIWEITLKGKQMSQEVRFYLTWLKIAGISKGIVTRKY
jgi:hypothetical protein